MKDFGPEQGEPMSAANPDFEAFASVVTNPVWVEGAGRLREETVADSRLLVTYPEA